LIVIIDVLEEISDVVTVLRASFISRL